jgi:glycosyltransferase involved in cell wall biosynthesis/tetratricopeptide (TPR) repeat protein
MSRPTIALCMICKNEAHNVGPMLQSVRGCFDEIHITDTGSTDGTLEFLEKINAHIEAKNPEWLGLPKIHIHKFEWINDFAAARNYSFSFAKSDYLGWLDLDDRLSDKAAFIKWRDELMHSAHYWLALYNYAFDKAGNPECKFIRERVVARDYGFKWKYFVHEGLVQEEGRKFWPQRASSWWVNHARTEEDKAQDHLRNIKLIESHDVEQMPSRMKFYYGKELVEHGFPEKGGKPLMEAIKSQDLDMHDRVLAIQYAAMSALQSQALPQAIDLLYNGLKLVPSRAEFWCLIGDCYMRLNQITHAILAYTSALACRKDDMGGVIVNFDHAYGEYPHRQLAQIFAHKGDAKTALEHVSWLKEQGFDASELEAKAYRVLDLGTLREGLPKTGDIIITCPPGAAITDWDEQSLKAKGHGGSETAAIEVAKWLKQKTKRNVKVFQPRSRREVMPSGVEYLPISELEGYVQNVEPYAHIAWRHATRLTKAKSFVWCHDLQCPNADQTGNYDKIVALSGFHANYLQETNGVPKDKIALGFNGINPADFPSAPTSKDPLKVVFSSSPDRGLVQSIDIVKRAREKSGLDLKLHCFYGTANMRKMGLNDWADQIEAKINENDFVTYHGMVTKADLMQHFKESAVWLYPADFIETYCITAIEALCAGVWPIVRDMGALKYTMKEAIKKDMCDVLHVEVKDERSTDIWADALVAAVKERKWRRVDVSPEDYSWEKVADFFKKEMAL